jgi:hypothetical protein
MGSEGFDFDSDFGLIKATLVPVGRFYGSFMWFSSFSQQFLSSSQTGNETEHFAFTCMRFNRNFNMLPTPHFPPLTRAVIGGPYTNH